MEQRFLVCHASWIAHNVAELEIDAPGVARAARAGQFVIVRATPDGERIPLTICGTSPEAGTIRLVVQAVGRSTADIAAMRAGDRLQNVLGPLGRPTEVGRFGTCVVVAGGVGAAIALPVARAYADAGNRVIGVIGGRSRSTIVLANEIEQVCEQLIITTEDGSQGVPGRVTDALERLIADQTIDRVFAVGPIPMMQGVSDLTAPMGTTTIASLNPIMVDGTGMCGGCRVTVAGATKFACVDGPEFDAHEVDFAALARRNEAYRMFERCQLELRTANE